MHHQAIANGPGGNSDHGAARVRLYDHAMYYRWSLILTSIILHGVLIIHLLYMKMRVRLIEHPHGVIRWSTPIFCRSDLSYGGGST